MLALPLEVIGAALIAAVMAVAVVVHHRLTGRPNTPPLWQDFLAMVVIGYVGSGPAFFLAFLLAGGDDPNATSSPVTPYVALIAIGAGAGFLWSRVRHRQPVLCVIAGAIAVPVQVSLTVALSIAGAIR